MNINDLLFNEGQHGKAAAKGKQTNPEKDGEQP
jgi:hypothetical protein